jgi:hypothetical protein
VATGGWAPIIARETSVIDAVNLDLTLFGLWLIHETNKTRGSEPCSKEKGSS